MLSGELHVIDINLETGCEISRRIRKTGDYASKGPGDVHMEMGGPEGALVLFNLFTADDQLADTLAKDGTVISQSTLSQILGGRSAR